MKKKTKWKNRIALILFIISTGTIIIGGMWLALSTICVTYEGTIIVIALLTISGATGDYLKEKYDEIK